jgi:hypothetical protein
VFPFLSVVGRVSVDRHVAWEVKKLLLTSLDVGEVLGDFDGDVGEGHFLLHVLALVGPP